MMLPNLSCNGVDAKCRRSARIIQLTQTPASELHGEQQTCVSKRNGGRKRKRSCNNNDGTRHAKMIRTGLISANNEIIQLEKLCKMPKMDKLKSNYIVPPTKHARIGLSYIHSLVTVLRSNSSFDSVATVLEKNGLVPPPYVFVSPLYRDSKKVFDTGHWSPLPTFRSTCLTHPTKCSMKRIGRDARAVSRSRPLTSREAGVLSGFKPTFPWNDDPSKAGLGIANAVPPPLGELVIRLGLCASRGKAVMEDVAALSAESKGDFGMLIEPLITASNFGMCSSKTLIIDFCCGIGGFSHAAHSVFGDEATILGFDNDSFAMASYIESHAAHPRVFGFCIDVTQTGNVIDIVHRFTNMIGADKLVILSGSPCQDFSTCGKGRETMKRAGLLPLMAYYARRLHADVCISENVVNAQNSVACEDFQRILTCRATKINKALKCGRVAGDFDVECDESGYNGAYDLTSIVLCATDVNLPTQRKRLFQIAMPSRFKVGKVII